MFKKGNKLALLLIIGICITWHGNFEAESKVIIEPNYGYPEFVQHPHSENRANRESDTSETDQYIDVDHSGRNTNDDLPAEFTYDEYDDLVTQNMSDQYSRINKVQSGQNTTDDEQDEFINNDQSTQNVTDQHIQINKDQSGQNTNDDKQDEFIDNYQSGQNTNNTQTSKLSQDRQGNINGSVTDDDEDAELPVEDAELPVEDAELPVEDVKLPVEDAELPIEEAELPDEGANRPDEDSEFPKTVKQSYWNYYAQRKIPPKPDNESDTGIRHAYGSKSVQIEIPPEVNSGSTVTNKANIVLKWHVGIYTKITTPYMQICGGTLVTLYYVISAAHCFWDNKEAVPAEQYAVGAGKLYRPWFDAHETYSQTSDVSAIHIPSRYRGSLTNFQNDIALVKLSLTLRASPAVLPACVSFDESLDEEQLSNGTAGTVMGWGLTEEDGGPSQVLNYVELPPLPVDECFKQSDSEFFKYITSDKICAGVTGQGLCTGDSGGGLVFLDGSSPPVPYLRGVASTAPSNEHACNTATFAAFTHVFHHRLFLLKHLPQLESDCQRRYKTAIVENKNSCQRSKHKSTIYSPYYGTTSYCDCYTI